MGHRYSHRCPEEVSGEDRAHRSADAFLEASKGGQKRSNFAAQLLHATLLRSLRNV